MPPLWSLQGGGPGGGKSKSPLRVVSWGAVLACGKRYRTTEPAGENRGPFFDIKEWTPGKKSEGEDSMTLETPRLILRPFTPEDAADLYEYAQDPRVGPAAGWPPHRSLAESREIIASVFSAPNTFAVVDKPTGKVIGSAGFVGRHQTALSGPDDEIGYALSPDFWGRGLMPEAVEELLRYGFEELGLQSIWCNHWEQNQKSRRVIEKCGFLYRFTENTWEELMGEERTVCYYALTREEWKTRQAADGHSPSPHTDMPL